MYVQGVKKNRVYGRSQFAVHAGELKLVVEVGHGTNAAHHGFGLQCFGELNHQPVKSFHAHIRAIGQGLARHLQSLLQIEHGFFVMGAGHGDHHHVKHTRGAAHNVFVPQGNRIKRARVQSNHWLRHKSPCGY